MCMSCKEKCGHRRRKDYRVSQGIVWRMRTVRSGREEWRVESGCCC